MRRHGTPRCVTRGARRAAAWLLPGAALLLSALPLGAQSPGDASEDAIPPLLTALDQDMAVVEEKLRSLAGALPDSAWVWRPGPGVRSSEEVLEHVAYDNFYFPTALGIPAPAGTGITADYATARAWAEKARGRDAVLEALDASFLHLRSALRDSGGASLDETVTLFGRSMDRRRYWVLATTHLHEHLGQLIAYARTHGVVPPWSTGG